MIAVAAIWKLLKVVGGGVGRWVAKYPWTLLVILGAGLAGFWKMRADRAQKREGEATRARVNAENTTAATIETLERRDAGAATNREVIDAAKHATEAHPDDPDAAGRAADDYARMRHEQLHEADAHGRRADPVPRPAAPGTPAGGRKH